MLQKLLLFAFLFIASTVTAQKNATLPSKAAEKQGEPKIDYTKIGAPMPPLKILAYQDTTKKKKSKNEFITEKDFDYNANLLVMMFNPNCSHCQDETELLEKNIFLFKKSKLLLVASAVMTPYLPAFYNSMHIAEYSTISIGADSSNFINNVFLYRPLPQINVYDSDRKLIKIFSGEVLIDSLQEYIQ